MIACFLTMYDKKGAKSMKSITRMINKYEENENNTLSDNNYKKKPKKKQKNKNYYKIYTQGIFILFFFFLFLYIHISVIKHLYHGNIKLLPFHKLVRTSH